MAVEINDELISHIARLSRLSLPEDERVAICRELGSMVRYVEKLDELDTSDVEPSPFTLDLHNVLRDDSVKPSLSVEDALSNGPAAGGGFFRVPRIISEAGGEDDLAPSA